MGSYRTVNRPTVYRGNSTWHADGLAGCQMYLAIIYGHENPLVTEFTPGLVVNGEKVPYQDTPPVKCITGKVHRCQEVVLADNDKVLHQVPPEAVGQRNPLYRLTLDVGPTQHRRTGVSWLPKAEVTVDKANLECKGYRVRED